MSTYETIAAGVAAIFVAWLVARLNVPGLSEGFGWLTNYFASTKEELNITILEDLLDALYNIMVALHNDFTRALDRGINSTHNNVS